MSQDTPGVGGVPLDPALDAEIAAFNNGNLVQEVIAQARAEKSIVTFRETMDDARRREAQELVGAAGGAAAFARCFGPSDYLALLDRAEKAERLARSLAQALSDQGDDFGAWVDAGEMTEEDAVWLGGDPS